VSSDAAGKEGQEVPLGSGAATIGRSDDCTIVIKDNRISRRHANVELVDGRVRVVDNGSANGIWVGDKQVQSLDLEPGGRFRIASTIFELVGPPPPPLPAPAPPPPPEPAAEDAAPQTLITSEIPEFVVRVVGGKGAPVGKEVKAATGFVTLGRGEDCSFPLQDESASRRHARVEALAGGSFRVVDTGSANGVWVDQKRVAGDQVVRAGEKFRIGETILECHPVEKKKQELNATRVMSDLAELMAGMAAEGLAHAGEAVALGGNKVVLLNDPSTSYYVVGGKVEIFTVTVKDGKPLGARNHFLTLGPGDAFFGMDLSAIPDSGFVASGKSGTQVRKIAVADLRRLSQEKNVAQLVANLVDKWVTGLAGRLTREIFPKPETDVKLAPDVATALPAGKVAKSGGGVVWVDVSPGTLTFVGMATLLPFSGNVLFPVTPQVWLEPAGETAEVPLVPVATLKHLQDEALWGGLDLFHQALCECEFINKRLAVVDEFQRLSSKAKQSQAAKAAAYDAIGAVLAGSYPEQTDFGSTGAVEPVLAAARAVGKVLKLKIKPPIESKVERTFDDHVTVIAGASRFRTRKIALRGDWWKHDGGPLLARIEATSVPVALIPKGPRAYEWVEAGKPAQRVRPELAETLAPFAYTFYRPFPSGTLGVWDLLKFGSLGLRSDLWTMVAMGVVTGAFGAITPYLTGQMIDKAIPQGERGLLVQLGLGMLVTALASAAFKITQSIAVARVESKMDYSLEGALWDRLLDLPSGFFRKYGAGDLASRAAGVNAIRALVSRAGVTGILASLSSVAYVFQMFFYQYKLGLVAILLTFILVGATTLGNYLQMGYQRNEAQMQGRISGLILQLIIGVAKVRVCAAENHAFRVWAQRFSDQKRLGFSIGQVQNPVATFSAGFQVLSSLGLFGALYYLQATATTAEEAHALSTGTFIAFNAAFGAFVTAMQSLSDASLSLLRAVPVYERMRPILETIPETDETKASPGRIKGEISISHIQFRYREDTPYILKDVSLKIQPGQFIAFVGGSGCGKSTMMRLLLGFEKPGIGAIYYDGQDLSTVDLRAFRQQLGVVLQESRVLPTDIFRNIVGTTSHTMDEAWEAAEMAGLAEDVRAMPMQMHTVVSEGGGTFSGGQRQRLLIARALVNKPRIIFFDEATSALDNKAQAVVTQSMDRMDATRIVIAHRLSTVANADIICYFDGGQIKEQGNYDELMAKDGLFATLAKRQIS
jgi:ATP-binding cassette subfamily C protein